MLLEIKDLRAGFEGVEIIKGISLTVNEGEIHSIMGPNGSGKSTFSKVLVGHPAYEVMGGSITCMEKDLLAMSPEERALEGVFMTYQDPVEVPGVNNAEFMRMAYNARLVHHGQDEVDPLEFDELLDDKMRLLDMGEKYKERALNEGFSGGEKKKNEVLQMAILEPKLAILDEIDSGLDIDALRVVAESVKKLAGPDNALVLITHYQRLLSYIEPDYVHVLSGGRIIKSGDSSLAHRLEAEGYDKIIAEEG